MPNGDKARKMTRRDTLRTAAAAGMAVGVAGCTSDEGESKADVITTDTTTTSDDTTAEDEKSSKSVVSDTFKTYMHNPPEQLNLNPWAATPTLGMIKTWTSDLIMPRHQVNNKRFLSGHTWEITGLDGDKRTVKVQSLGKNLDIKPPKDYYWDLNTELTYWNGQPIDAKAIELSKKIDFLSTGAHLDGKEFTDGVAEGDYRLHFQTESERSKLDLKRTISLVSEIPLPPEFTKPWVEKLEDATTQKEVNKVTKELGKTKVSLDEYIENGWGSGPYKIESTDDVTQTKVSLHKREDHPAAGQITVPKMDIRIASRDRLDLFQQKGKIDAWHGIMSEKGRGHAYRRGAIPEYIQESDRFLTEGGAQMMFNWKNKHLQRLNFRRALVTAVDWFLIQRNWAGEHNIPLQQDTGLADTADNRWFSDDFVNSLHDWNVRKDYDQAAKFMKKAGYTKEDGNWVGPDGNVAELTFTNGTIDEGWIVSAQTFKRHLDDFGIKVKVNNLQVSSWNTRLQNGKWDVSWLWYDGSHPLAAFTSHDAWWKHSLLGGVGSATHGWNADNLDQVEKSNDGRPLTVEIPTEPGALDLSGGSETVDLVDTLYQMRAPGTGKKELKELARTCARWYNYAVPDFKFKQDQWSIIRNVKDFDWPKADHESYPMSPWGAAEYQLKSGNIHTTTDDDYPKPDQV